MSIIIHKPPRKIDLTSTYGEWIANPKCSSHDPAEQNLIGHRGDILVYAEISDDEASYSYDDFALIRLGKDWYLLNTTGCSCPDPSETWNIQIGPASLKAVKEFVEGGNYSGYTVPKKQLGEFLAAFKAAR